MTVTAQVSGLTKSFGGAVVLDGIDLALPQAGTTAIVGSSGCGKTTLLRLIAGFETPDSGSVVISTLFDPTGKAVVIEVADTGKGISPEDKGLLFEPYFSTKKTGMGLGLSIVNAIIEDHNGTIRAEDNMPRGTKFIINLPA